MSEIIWRRFRSHSDNLKSAIQNPKWVGMIALTVTFAMCGEVAMAQQTGKVFRIAYLDPSTESAVADFLDAFRKELSKLGWIEGKNLSIEYRFAEQKLDHLPELAAELANQKVDLIVVGTGQAPLAAKKATSTIPIVMRASVDPVGAGLIASLAQPGGNITGLSGLSPELNTKRLEILKEGDPQTLTSCVSADDGGYWISYERPAAKRNQGCGYGTEVELGGDQYRTGRQKFGER